MKAAEDHGQLAQPAKSRLKPKRIRQRSPTCSAPLDFWALPAGPTTATHAPLHLRPRKPLPQSRRPSGWAQTSAKQCRATQEHHKKKAPTCSARMTSLATSSLEHSTKPYPADSILPSGPLRFATLAARSLPPAGGGRGAAEQVGRLPQQAQRAPAFPNVGAHPLGCGPQGQAWQLQMV